MNRDARDFPTRRRRHARKGDLVEQAILDTAERLLVGAPLQAVTVDQLAAGAGISRSTFYFYFPSREAVLVALAERLEEELYGAAEAWLRRSDEEPAAAVRRAVSGTLALWRRHGPVLRAVVQGRETDPAIRAFSDRMARRFVDATAAHIERERAQGVAPDGPSARALAAVLAAMNEQACFNATRRRRSAVSDRNLVVTLTSVWVRSVYGTDEPR